jgi:hypothetical protein
MATAGGATVQWDREKKRWFVEIQVGSEVIKRPFPEKSRQASVETLQGLAVAMAGDEGYELDPAHVIVVH